MNAEPAGYILIKKSFCHQCIVNPACSSLYCAIELLTHQWCLPNSPNIVHLRVPRTPSPHTHTPYVQLPGCHSFPVWNSMTQGNHWKTLCFRLAHDVIHWHTDTRHIYSWFKLKWNRPERTLTAAAALGCDLFGIMFLNWFAIDCGYTNKFHQKQILKIKGTKKPSSCNIRCRMLQESQCIILIFNLFF